MKLIVAIVPPERLDAVQWALSNNSAESIHATETRDLRAQSTEHYRGVAYHQFRNAVRVEALVLNEMFLEDTVHAVAEACAGTPDDRGSILVLDVQGWLPIRGPETRFASIVAA
jgi:nitrogen regulatory protein PII